MTFKTQLTADLATFYNTSDFAETITYNGASKTAIVTRQSDENISENIAVEAEIRVRVSDVASVSHRDAVVIGGDTFYVFQDRGAVPRKSDDGLEWIIPLYRAEKPVL